MTGSHKGADMNGNLEPLFRADPAPRPVKGILLGFTAALCWWIGIAGTANNSGGTPYLVVPALVTALAFVVVRRERNARGRYFKTPPIRRHRFALPRARAMIAILCGFTALLSWWIAIVAFVVSGGDIQAIMVFLFVPVASTIGTFFAARSAGWMGKGNHS